jgi:hypothetical protein
MYNACMVALQIRDVPKDVRDALAAQARARGQSLQGYLLALITEEARRSRNPALLTRFARRADGERSQPGEIAAELASARADRDEAVGGRW